MELSVVIPTFNAADHLEEQLEALERQDTAVSWELIVSDNGSTDATLRVVRDHAGRLPLARVVDASDKRGPAYARNAGAAQARGAVLLFCDADDVADGLWINEMARALRNAQLVGGRLENLVLNPGDMRHWRTPLQDDRLPEFGGRPFVASSNMGCRRELFQRLGGFDEGFSEAAGEDVDFAYRAADTGCTPVFVPTAIIHYRHRQDLSRYLQQARSYGRASLALRERHGIPTPTLADDLVIYSRQLKRFLWSALMRSGFAVAARFALAYRLEETRELWKRPAYWSLRRNEPDPRHSVRPTKKSELRLALSAAVRRLSGARAAETSSDALANLDPWSALEAIRRRMSVRQRHLLGAGLLADAGVEIHSARDGMRFLINPSMDPILDELISAGGYSRKEFAAVSDYLGGVAARGEGGDSVVVNAGANIGTTAIMFARAGYQVVAIEPARRAVELLEENVALNGLREVVTIVPAAVTASENEVELVVGDNLSISEIRGDNQIAALGSPADGNLHVEVAPGRPLSTIIASLAIDPRDVALVWSDTEGAEEGVIKGGTDLWEAGVPLWVEIRPSALRDHGRVTDFVKTASAWFSGFRTLDDLESGRESRSMDHLRDFIDDVGYGRWSFSDILLTA